MQLKLNLDGYCSGPLFEPTKKKRPPVRPTNKAGVIHRAQTRRATPAWSDAAAVRRFYADAKRLSVERGELYVVDHIVPKIHPLVCGLHVPANLRVIHWRENAQKGNWWWPGMPIEQAELDL